MITEERKKTIFNWATVCFIEDETQPDGVNLARPAICNDEEWEWLNSNYHKSKEELFNHIKLYTIIHSTIVQYESNLKSDFLEASAILAADIISKLKNDGNE